MNLGERDHKMEGHGSHGTNRQARGRGKKRLPQNATPVANLFQRNRVLHPLRVTGTNQPEPMRLCDPTLMRNWFGEGRWVWCDGTAWLHIAWTARGTVQHQAIVLSTLLSH